MCARTKPQVVPTLRFGHKTLLRLIAANDRLSLDEAEYRLAVMRAHNTDGILLRTAGGPVLRFPDGWQTKEQIVARLYSYTGYPHRELVQARALLHYAKRGLVYEPRSGTTTPLYGKMVERLLATYPSTT
jgi:hypothetical protein